MTEFFGLQLVLAIVLVLAVFAAGILFCAVLLRLAARICSVQPMPSFGKAVGVYALAAVTCWLAQAGIGTMMGAASTGETAGLGVAIFALALNIGVTALLASLIYMHFFGITFGKALALWAVHLGMLIAIAIALVLFLMGVGVMAM